MPAPLVLLLALACVPTRDDGRDTSGGQDSDSAESPAPPAEVCNGEDDDGDGLTDDQDEDLDLSTATAWHPDADGDGYGDDETTIYACQQPYANAIELAGDCDDDRPWVNPESPEVCDGVDDDCDGLTDDQDDDLEGEGTTPGYADADGDGFGDPASLGYGCAEDERVSNADDCDDADGATYPHAEEVCGDDLDQDCDGMDTVCGGLFGALDPSSDAYATLAGDNEDGAFGDSLDLLDWDGDGVADLVVGASLSSDGAVEGGAVFVYLGPLGPGELDSRDAAIAEIKGVDARKYLGSTLARVPDLDGDGDDELYVSSSSEASRGVVEGGSLSGEGSVSDVLAAVVYCTAVLDLGEEGTWGCGANAGGVRVFSGLDVSSPVATIDTDDPADDLGVSAEGGRDLDGDGVADLWAGASGVTFSYGDEGAVWRVSGPLEDTVLSSDSASVRGGALNQGLGETVVVADVDGDGYPDGFAGSALDDTGASNAGAWFGWMGPIGDGLGPSTADIALYGDEEEQKLGDQVPSAADQDGDGREDLLILSFRDDGGAGTNDGAAWIFYGPLSGTLDLGDAAEEGAIAQGASGDHLGSEGAMGQDLTGDGAPDLVLAASMATWADGVASSGVVYLFAGGL